MKTRESAERFVCIYKPPVAVDHGDQRRAIQGALIGSRLVKRLFGIAQRDLAFGGYRVNAGDVVDADNKTRWILAPKCLGCDRNPTTFVVWSDETNDPFVARANMDWDANCLPEWNCRAGHGSPSRTAVEGRVPDGGVAPEGHHDAGLAGLVRRPRLAG